MAREVERIIMTKYTATRTLHSHTHTHTKTSTARYRMMEGGGPPTVPRRDKIRIRATGSVERFQ